MTKDELINLIKKRLAAVHPGIDFDVVADGVRQDDSWWYVPILATRGGKDVPREFAINVYANIEAELDKEDHLSVLFVPAVPD